MGDHYECDSASASNLPYHLANCIDGFLCKPATLSAAEPLLVVNSALNMLTVPLWVAKERDYFHKYGLDVDTIYISSGTMGMQALLAGETLWASK